MKLGECMSNRLIETGGPAFPGENEFGYEEPGMDMRDYFAAQVLTSIISSENCSHMTDERKVIYAYSVADTMLKVRLSDNDGLMGNKDFSDYEEAIDRLKSAYEYIRDADYFTSCIGSKDDLLDSIGKTISVSGK